MRAKAGWFVALLYLFCVLAPGVALALGDAASCHVFGMAADAAHVHEGAQPEHEASHPHQADTGHVMPGHAGHPHDGKASTGPCCVMLCVSAIVADPPAVANPSPPVSFCVSENFQRLPDEAPPLLYRPPIA
jgi:hypothetical protein